MSDTDTATATVRDGRAVRRYTRRSALALGAAAVTSGVVLARAGSASASESSVELGPATVLVRGEGGSVPPVPQVSGYRPTFARWCYSGNPAASGGERWAWQTLQGDRPKPSGVAAPLVYATAVKRSSDPAGVTQCVRPDDVQEAWLMRSASGAPLHRGTDNSGGDVMLDIGNPDFQAAAARALVAKCQAEGWGGVYLDEVNGELGWGGWNAPAARYDDAAFRSAELAFVGVLASALSARGLSLAVNIGEALYRSWCSALAATGATLCAEYFVAGTGGGAANATAEDGRWTDRVDWLESALATQPHVVVHEMQIDPARVAYGLATFLLVDNGRGAYGASTEYSAAVPWLSLYDDARQLGSPVGARTQVAPGVWRRDFERGHVLVNSSASARSFEGATLPAASGRISIG